MVVLYLSITVSNSGLLFCTNSEPMTGSLGWRLRRAGGAHSIPVSVASLRSEPMTGIEPAYLAWEASALPLSYIGVVPTA